MWWFAWIFLLTILKEMWWFAGYGKTPGFPWLRRTKIISVPEEDREAIKSGLTEMLEEGDIASDMTGYRTVRKFSFLQ
jgi:hypothetical protein